VWSTSFRQLTFPRTNHLLAQANAGFSGGSERGDAGLELVRRAYGLRFDSARPEQTARSIEAFLSLLAPQVEFVDPAGVWGPALGTAAVRNLLIDASDQWAECSFAVEEVGQIDRGQVLARGWVLARAEQQTEVYEIRFANIWTIENGRAVRIESFADDRRELKLVE
jgi:ketosteroid isomerase-like protein